MNRLHISSCVRSPLGWLAKAVQWKSRPDGFGKPSHNLSCVLVGLVVCCGLAPARPAQAVDKDDLKARQQAQVKARILARELVSGVLSIQIRQLRENGLDNLPIYKDIRQMRKNIDGLVEQEMDDVVELLVKAQLAK